MRAAVLLAVFALLLASGAARAADASVWSGLVFATNEEKPCEAPPELRKFKTKLENVFGYNQFELIGQHAEVMDEPREQWLIPSKNFCLRVESKTASKCGYLLKLELFQDQQLLTRFEANLGRQ